MPARKLTISEINPPIIKGCLRKVVARHPGIVLLYLFGSQRRGDVGPMSDIDVGVLIDSADHIGEIRSDLTTSIALVTDHERIDVVILNHANVELAYAVVATGEVIYQRDEYARVEYEAKIMSLYGDYLPVLRAQRDDLLRGDQHESRVQRYREALGRTERTLGALRGAEGQIPR